MIFIAVVGRQMTTETLQITIKKIILTICLPVKVGYKKKKQTYIILNKQTESVVWLLWSIKHKKRYLLPDLSNEGQCNKLNGNWKEKKKQNRLTHNYH